MLQIKVTSINFLRLTPNKLTSFLLHTATFYNRKFILIRILHIWRRVQPIRLNLWALVRWIPRGFINFFLILQTRVNGYFFFFFLHFYHRLLKDLPCHFLSYNELTLSPVNIVLPFIILILKFIFYWLGFQTIIFLIYTRVFGPLPLTRKIYVDFDVFPGFTSYLLKWLFFAINYLSDTYLVQLSLFQCFTAYLLIIIFLLRTFIAVFFFLFFLFFFWASSFLLFKFYSYEFHLTKSLLPQSIYFIFYTCKIRRYWTDLLTVGY